MAMAMPLSFFPATSISLSSSPSPRRLPHLVFACSVPAPKSRVIRKPMSDADLCKGLLEFVSSVGFPDGHVPSTKELAVHGRKDLANIVRRRGHKVVKELLANSIGVDNRSDTECGLTEGQNSGSREHMENSTGSNLAIHGQRDPCVTRDREDPLMLNGTSVMSKPIAKSVPRRNNMRDNDASVESPADSAIGRDMNLETSEMENQDEVERLKLILQQKELELSQLRELMEKEEQDLSTLQCKAEEEIKNAQKLISDMDAELLAVEDSLAGLKEVQVQYKGEAQGVEIAGSFNGWHQNLKMDPHPDTAEDFIKSRNPRLWCTSLWLYPGEYEIKFIVDGVWKIDPEREIITRSGNQNNILRVDG